MTNQVETPCPAPEFSRIVQADRVPDGAMEQRIEASPAERGALARRFELEAIESLVATVRLGRVRGGPLVRVEGSLEAEVVQTCTVTLDPVRNRVADTFTTLFAPPHLVPKDESAIDLDPMAEDVPEPLIGGRIDIGELTAQYLSLALDPYPRAPGVAFDGGAEDDAIEPGRDVEPAEEASSKRPNPFTALARLKRPH